MVGLKGESLGRLVTRAMKVNGLNNSELAKLTGFSDTTIGYLKRFGVDPKSPVPTVQLLVAVSNIVSLHPVRVLQMAGHLPTSAYSTVGALGEYTGLRFEGLPLMLQTRLLESLGELEKEAGLEPLGDVVRRFSPEAEVLGVKRARLNERVGAAVGRLIGAATDGLLLAGVQ